MKKSSNHLAGVMIAALAMISASAYSQTLDTADGYGGGVAQGSQLDTAAYRAAVGDNRAEPGRVFISTESFAHAPATPLAQVPASIAAVDTAPLASAPVFNGPRSYETISTLDGRTIITNAPPIEGCNAGLRFYPYIGKYWCSSLVPPVGYQPPAAPPVPSGYSYSEPPGAEYTYNWGSQPPPPGGASGGGMFGGALACSSAGCLMQDGTVHDTFGAVVGSFGINESGNIVANFNGVSAIFDVGGSATQTNNGVGNFYVGSQVSSVITTQNPYGADTNAMFGNIITVETLSGGISVATSDGSSLNTVTGVLTNGNGDVIGSGQVTDNGINVSFGGTSGAIDFGQGSADGQIGSIGGYSGDAAAAIYDAAQTTVWYGSE